jgi:acyl carrier protein
LARGYLNRPELTAERFVPDLFCGIPGARMYRSGDQARYLRDGAIEFLGRLDDQVKIRGFRIEPGEIEAVLAEHPAVRQAVVLAREDTPSDKRLVAYVVPADAALTDTEPLRTHVRERLPEYMRPAAYVLLEHLPLTPNGKIERKALPVPEYGSDRAGDTHVPPRNTFEEVVAEIWQNVLKIERVGVHDNFFELGGHSLLATQVIARLDKLLHVELPLRGFFQSPSVSALAAEIENKLGTGEARESAPVAPAPRDSDLALSFAQQRLWFLDRLLPDKAAYNIPGAWQLQGPLDVPALERSLSALVARHETLRTRFALREGEPVQVIQAAQPVALALSDLSALKPAEREARARQIANAHAHHPFDLETEIPLRTQLLRLGAQEHLLLVNVHHIASDGWSMGVLARELSALYAAFTKGREPDLAALPIQYADYAAWQRQWLQGQVLERQLAYWKQRLADVAPLELPTDRSRPPMASYKGARLDVELPQALVQALKALGQREGATLFMTLLSAFQVLLYRYSGQEDIAVGTPIAGRGRTEIEGLIGFFANTLVLRSDLSAKPSFRELLARVRETALGAYTHQDLPTRHEPQSAVPGDVRVAKRPECGARNRRCRGQPRAARRP